MKNRLWWLVVGLLLFSLACNTFAGGEEDNAATSQPEDPPAATATEKPPVSEEGDGFTIQVANQSDYGICYVFISPSESDDWGEDWLDEAETIAPGATRDFEVPAGNYDVKVSNCEFETLTTAWEIAAADTVEVGGNGRIAFVLTNVNEVDVCYAQLSPSSLDSWGDDALGDKEILAAGDSRVFFLMPGTYDILLSDCDEQALAEEYELEITQDAAWTLTGDGLVQDGMVDDGGPFYLEVENASDYDVCYIYISSSDADEWDDDWLGEGETISSGESWRSEYIPAGSHDIKLEDCAGAVLATAWEIKVDTTMTIGGFGQTSLEIINESSTEICYAYFSFSSADEWGMDWMGQYETILADGGTRIFFVEPGTYDLLVQDCDGDDLVTETEVVIDADGTTWTISD
ncbi:MAG: hypothetical protein K8R89_03205 [Anaerolineae bacterium]|nr:hypothetical protein [Anaerolineae bacterium]